MPGKSKCFVLFFVVICMIESYAFGPAAHYAVLIKVKQQLPSNSIVKTALNQYMKIAMTGANGPDLGYGQVRVVLGYAPWADRFHYDKVGSMSFHQLKDALSSNNNKKIAFAAGWITHVAADLACHGIYVNPEAGVFLDNSSGRELHADLESWSEPYLWHYAGLNLSNYNKTYLPSLFSNSSDAVSLLRATSNKVYGKYPSTSEVNQWYSLYTTSLKLGFGPYVYTSYNSALQNLNSGTRKVRLENAFNKAVEDAVKLLLEVE